MDKFTKVEGVWQWSTVNHGLQTKQRHEGYLLIDDRASGGQKLEDATLTCSHCHRTFLKNQDRVRPRNYCAKCDSYVCDNPGCNTGECLPLWWRFDLLLTNLINKGV